MPLYAFESSDGQYQDFFYKMADVPSLGTAITDENGIVWKRVFTKPNAAIATQMDPYSVKQFNSRLDGKNITVGDMWEASKEASEKRAAKEGVDPIKKKYLENYKKERKGQEHSVEKKEKFDKIQKDLGISVNLKAISGR
jgi:hypothetical protein